MYRKIKENSTKCFGQAVKFYNPGNKTCGHIKVRSKSDRFRLEYLMKMGDNEEGQSIKALNNSLFQFMPSPFYFCGFIIV